MKENLLKSLEDQEITAEKLENLLKARFEGKITDLANLPSPLDFLGVAKAIERLKSAINNNEKILIVGDYDADGVNSTAIMVHFFRILNSSTTYGNFDYIIPDRFTDGYGINAKLLEKYIATNTKPNVIITVDNGISAFEAGEFCQSKNIDLIITDHHMAKDKLPIAFAIFNPRLDKDFKDEMCGAAVAWYLLKALAPSFNININHLLVFVAIATIADVMPLDGISRVLFGAGMRLIPSSKLPAIAYFRSKCFRGEINSSVIGFKLAPIINAAGRMQHASVALEFLLSQNLIEAQNNFEKLEALNNERKTLSKEITDKCIKDKILNDNVVIAYGSEFHKGIVGIVAARLVELYKRPSFVFQKMGDKLSGSGRSYGSVDLNAVLKNMDFLEYGGHQGAVGIKIEEQNIPKMLDAFAVLDLNLQECEEFFHLEVKNINEKILQIIADYAPYGNANEILNFSSKIKISELKIASNFMKMKFENCDLVALSFLDNTELTIGDEAIIGYEILEDKNIKINQLCLL